MLRHWYVFYSCVFFKSKQTTRQFLETPIQPCLNSKTSTTDKKKMRLQEPWNSTKSVRVLKDHSPPLDLQVYPRPPALISCVPMHSPVLCSQIMKELIMSCWRNDGVSKENLHFNDHSTGKLIVFFKLHYFLKEIENMFSVFLSSYRDTRKSLGELEKSCGNTRLRFVFPQNFSFS